MVLHDLLKKMKRPTSEWVLLVLKWNSLGYPVKRLCPIVGMSRGAFYQHISTEGRNKKPILKLRKTGRPGYSLYLRGEIIDDHEIKNLIIKTIEGEGFNYGYRKIAFCLCKRSNMDTYTEKSFYVLSYIDVFDRTIVGYTVGRNCLAKYACEVLKQGML